GRPVSASWPDARSTRAPSGAASAARPSRAVFPAPAAPLSTSTCEAPSAARARACWIRRTSAARPTKFGVGISSRRYPGGAGGGERASVPPAGRAPAARGSGELLEDLPAVFDRQGLVLGGNAVLAGADA